MTFKRTGVLPTLLLVVVMLTLWVGWVNRQVSLPQASGSGMRGAHVRAVGGHECPFKGHTTSHERHSF